MKSDKTSFLGADVIDIISSLGKNIFSFADTTVRYIQKSITNKLKNVVSITIFLVTGLFFLLVSFVFFIYSFYQTVLLYLPDPILASLATGAALLAVSALLFSLLVRKLNQ